jgi:predicted esterase
MPSENKNNDTNKGNQHRGSQPSRRRQGPHVAKKKNEPSLTTSSGNGISQCLLILHGNRQTGQLLLGRLDKLRRRVLKEFHLDCVAPDAPLLHPEDANLRTWWNREENDDYQGLEQSLETLKSSEQLKDRQVVGILGFSQGARLAHLIALLHTQDRQVWFPTLKFVIIAAGYDAPIPDGFPSSSMNASKILLDSLHVWGLTDPLIHPDQSHAVTTCYASPDTHIHDGKHYVPMKAPDVEIFVNFIRKSLDVKDGDDSASKAKHIGTAKPAPAPVQASQATIARAVPPVSPPQIMSKREPDEETAMMQQDEVQALEAIFPDELILKSSKKEQNHEEVYDHPIIYQFKLLPSEDVDVAETNWPSRRLILEVTYPHNYPNETIPIFRLIHENNVYEFPSARVEILMKTIKDSANGELGMPSVLSCIYAARDYLDSPPSVTEATSAPSVVEGEEVEVDEPNDATHDDAEQAQSTTAALRTSTPVQINVCNLEGLSIAEEILRRPPPTTQATANALSNKKGGSLTYTIGLVGKPSAGKSTFFNAATAFSRQRGDKEGESGLGGASMAPHPFTTIDPNIGYCLVPAPAGSCPEDDAEQSHMYGSTHGRDPQGRRFLPVLLKDVAGLVPGAYQGRGRGNQFLNDLCDATVLIHVVDASGTADAQGNTTATDRDESSAYTNPLDDLAWLRNELVEWVYTNLMVKWDTIQRKGRSKVRMRESPYIRMLDEEQGSESSPGVFFALSTAFWYVHWVWPAPVRNAVCLFGSRGFSR